MYIPLAISTRSHPYIDEDGSSGYVRREAFRGLTTRVASKAKIIWANCCSGKVQLLHAALLNLLLFVTV